MTRLIKTYTTLRYDEEPYSVDLHGVPPGPLTDPEIPDRFDNVSITVPKTSGSVWLEARTAGGDLVGRATFAAGGDAVVCDDVFVEPDWHKQGVASLFYQLASAFFHAPVKPSEKQMDGGVAFWKGRTEILAPPLPIDEA